LIDFLNLFASFINALYSLFASLDKEISLLSFLGVLIFSLFFGCSFSETFSLFSSNIVDGAEYNFLFGVDANSCSLNSPFQQRFTVAIFCTGLLQHQILYFGAKIQIFSYLICPNEEKTPL